MASVLGALSRVGMPVAHDRLVGTKRWMRSVPIGMSDSMRLYK